MNTILIKSATASLRPFLSASGQSSLSFSLHFLPNDLDVQQSYPFTWTSCHTATNYQRQTVELRFEIKPMRNYANTLYHPLLPV